MGLTWAGRPALRGGELGRIWGRLGRLRADSWSACNRREVDLGSALGWRGVDSWSTLGRLGFDFGSTSGRLAVCSVSIRVEQRKSESKSAGNLAPASARQCGPVAISPPMDQCPKGTQGARGCPNHCTQHPTNAKRCAPSPQTFIRPRSHSAGAARCASPRLVRETMRRARAISVHSSRSAVDVSTCTVGIRAPPRDPRRKSPACGCARVDATASQGSPTPRQHDPNSAGIANCWCGRRRWVSSVR